jgi:hypothetical protein
VLRELFKIDIISRYAISDEGSGRGHRQPDRATAVGEGVGGKWRTGSSKPGKQVPMTEQEIKALCIKSKEIFASQPVFLELEAPLKICGQAFSRLA